MSSSRKTTGSAPVLPSEKAHVPPVSKSVNDDETPLIQAILSDDVLRVSEVVKAGADVNQRGKKCLDYPVVCAIKKCSKEHVIPILKILLKAGAEINKEPVLLTAARKRNDDLFAFLIECGADVKAKDKKGYTALHIAASLGEYKEVELLLWRGADVNAYACDDGEAYAAIDLVIPFESRKDIAKLLLNHGAEISSGGRKRILEYDSHPEKFLDHPIVNDYAKLRKMWLVFWDDSESKFALQRMCSLLRNNRDADEAVALLAEQLAAYAADNHDDYPDLIQNIARIFAGGLSGQLPDNKDLGPGFVKLINAKTENHDIAGLLIKASSDEYQLIFSNSCLRANGVVNQKVNPIKIVKIPARDIGSLSQYIASANRYYSSEEFLPETPGLTDDAYISVENFKVPEIYAGRSHIENYQHLILFLMQLSLGADEAGFLFKKFMQFMRQSVREYEYSSKSYAFADFLDRKGNVIVDLVWKYDIWNHNKYDTPFSDEITHGLKDIYQKTFYNTKDTFKSRLLAFLEVPQAKEYDVVKRRIVSNLWSRGVKWAAYILGGFIYLPVKNIVKLIVEVLPYGIQKAAKYGMQKLRAILADEVHKPSLLKTFFAGAGIAVLGLFYYPAKIVRVAARIVTSPAVSARFGWKIHPVLGVLSGIASFVAISLLAFFTNPLFLTELGAVATALHLPQVAAFASSAINFLFAGLEAARALGIIASFLLVMNYFVTGLKELTGAAWFQNKNGNPACTSKTMHGVSEDLRVLKHTVEAAPVNKMAAAKPDGNQDTKFILQTFVRGADDTAALNSSLKAELAKPKVDNASTDKKYEQKANIQPLAEKDKDDADDNDRPNANDDLISHRKFSC